MGRIRYGLWWVGQIAADVHAWSRMVAAAAAAIGRELRWATVLSARATAASLDAIRPSPWSDRKLLAFLSVVALCASTVAFVLGLGVSRWVKTAPDSSLFASAGAIAVGAVLLPMAFLVFASRRSSR
ncbi:hypothetical protein [Nocardiopsis sp. LOL_012]|uniref:hypothetical protein n=1 Tax=Nocardiopsis sp. LOL_012 TaxID=3345409 RepID=UPI003A8921FF